MFFDLHDRFQQNWFAFLTASFIAKIAAILNASSLGVDFVKGTVNDGHFHVDHGIAGQHAVDAPLRRSRLTAGMYSLGITPPTILFSLLNRFRARRVESPLPRVHIDRGHLIGGSICHHLGAGGDCFTVCDLRFAGVRVRL